MKLIKKILNKLNGLYYPQEYLCLAKESFEQPLHVYLANNGQVIKDITDIHLFIGYHPLIFALPSLAEIDLSILTGITVIFSNHTLQPNEVYKEKDAIATVTLRSINKLFAGNSTIYFYEGSHGKHRFVRPFHQLISSLNNRLYNKKQGNVFLTANLYKQVQIAYAVPRKISLITTRQDNLFNLFPTDLHGAINEQWYIISLRQHGKAEQQVEIAKRILLTEVEADFYRAVYSLGKNHMQEQKEKNKFPFSDAVSLSFRLPLPQHFLFYRELELVNSFIHGIHKIFLFKVHDRSQKKEETFTLAHIHNVYATWRQKNGLRSNYLLR